MKNILTVSCSIIFALLLSEMILRIAELWIPLDANYQPPTLISKWGYVTNPNSGNATQCLKSLCVKLHYYFPNLRDTKMNKNANHILVLGDSFTFGWLLPWNKTYVYYLQRDVDKKFGKNKYQLLNAATPGWGIEDYLGYLKQYGRKSSPKYVLIFLNTDDIGRAIKRSHLSIPLKKFKQLVYESWLYQHSLLLKFIHYRINSILQPILHKIYKHKYATMDFDSIETRNHVVFPGSPHLKFSNQYAIHFSEKIFLKINQWCEQHNAKLMVVTTGFNTFYPANLHDPTKIFLSVAPSFFLKEHIPFYDSAPAFRTLIQGEKFQIPDDHHPNKIGSKAIADATFQWIEHRIEK
ncbi:MAG: hypothetical protein A3C44_03365 [Gammaproteobacteria bacterium RIFCSPHIGHO2_02_FULL_39_13]|nr:MAG: hypothetical protein A3C44_03365 [Gammaproteobacteria bacterium RIFCSPHIGHO2_02_FULL_39_13]OGT48569.1 MAG: hypothetical protein A3E53_04255 [Gammaproteobacteria bacterium RIFCSPHIGHO2_12_FULL_39_24]